MKLSEMKQTLAEGGIQLTKSLGQNFLHDGNQLRRIADAAELGQRDKVLEIGPGLGPLTELLLERAGEVLAIETDRRLVEFLQKRFAGARHLTLLHTDALDYLRQHGGWGEWKMVSNLPYSVASPILVELARAAHSPRQIVATLQLEVAQRLMARAGDQAYGILTLLLQLRYLPHGCFKIPATCFHPAPDVDSGCIALMRRKARLLEPAAAEVFSAIVKRAFSQRRKMMFKLLRQDWPEPKLAEAFDALSLPRQARAETVTLEQFVRLTQRLAHTSPP
jgi:16S rRNA (adenine1518-N6/adenine1519-N6)-dimethyltransferase